MKPPDKQKTSHLILQDVTIPAKIYLSEISPEDKPWSKHRKHADTVESYYSGSDFDKYAERMTFCSLLLEFGFNTTEDDSLKLKLWAAKFCRVRHCPVCQWRRSLCWKARMYNVLPQIVEKYPTHRWLFLTITQKHVPITELRQTLVEMNKGWQRLIKRKAFPALGWMRSTEVTRSENGYAHQHFHCLLLVRPGYFNTGYLKQPEWSLLWRDVMRLDYDPLVDIRAVRAGTSPTALVPELAKYMTKESDLVADREWFLELTKQLHKMRAIATGGILKEYLRDMLEEPEDLIGSDGDGLDEDFGRLLFGWRRQEKKYKLID
jgi:plasmid rolling circle replication initiator protein Rep